MTAATLTRGRRGGDSRGNTTDRARRRAWLLATFGDGTSAPCFRCGLMLTEETLTVDRITPGRDGGTYARPNIRPACSADNSELGGRLAAGRPLVIGVDPGPIPGIAVIRPDGTVESLQVTAGIVLTVVRALLETAASVDGRWHAILAVEKFVIGHRSSRVKAPAASATTRNMVGQLEGLAAELGVPCVLRSASEVKPWATAGNPARVEVALLAPTGMVHARSAGWHALFSSVHDTGAPDPLSRRAARQGDAETPR